MEDNSSDTYNRHLKYLFDILIAYLHKCKTFLEYICRVYAEWSDKVSSIVTSDQ